jgi:hypothetical protein
MSFELSVPAAAAAAAAAMGHGSVSTGRFSMARGCEHLPRAKQWKEEEEEEEPAFASTL